MPLAPPPPTRRALDPVCAAARLGLALGVLLLLGACSGPGGEEPATRATSEDAPAATTPDETASEPAEPAGPTWVFEGEIRDLLREEPVAEAKVIFDNVMLQGVGTYTTTTDFGGSYRIELPSLGQNAYNVRIEHPDYDGRNTWTSDVLDTPKVQRYLLGTGIQAHALTGTHRGDDDFSTWLDLFIMPLNLTDEERRERSDAMRRYRGGGGP